MQCGVCVGHFFSACVRLSQAMKKPRDEPCTDLTMRHKGAIHIPKVLAFQWLRDGYIQIYEVF